MTATSNLHKIYLIFARTEHHLLFYCREIALSDDLAFVYFIYNLKGIELGMAIARAIIEETPDAKLSLLSQSR